MTPSDHQAPYASQAVSAADPRWDGAPSRTSNRSENYIAADDPNAAERWVGGRSRRPSAPQARRWPAERIEILTVFEGHRLFPRDVGREEP
jgi:hypothetical protein